MAYNEEIIISINPDESSVNSLNMTLENIANRAKSLGNTVSDYVDGIFSNIKAKGENITFGKALDLTKLDEVKKKLKGITNTINLDLDLNLNDESLLKISEGIKAFFVDNPVLVDVKARKLIMDKDFAKYQTIPLRATISNNNLKELKEIIKTFYEEDKNKVPLTFTVYPVKLSSVKKLLSKYFEDYPVGIHFKFTNISDLLYEYTAFREELEGKKIFLSFALKEFHNIMKTLGGLKSILHYLSGAKGTKKWKINLKLEDISDISKRLNTIKEDLAKDFYIGDIKGVSEAVLKLQKLKNTLSSLNLKDLQLLFIINNLDQVISDLKELHSFLPKKNIEINIKVGESVTQLKKDLISLREMFADSQDVFKNIKADKLSELSGVLETARKRAIGLQKSLNSIKDVLTGSWAPSYFKQFEDKILRSIDRLEKLYNSKIDIEDINIPTSTPNVSKEQVIGIKTTGIKEAIEDVTEAEEAVKKLALSIDNLNVKDMTNLFKGSEKLKRELKSVQSIRFGENLKAQTIEAIQTLQDLGNITSEQAERWIRDFEKMDLKALNYFTNAKKMFTELGVESSNYSNVLKSLTNFDFFKSSRDKGGKGSFIFSDLDTVRANLMRNELKNILETVRATTGETDLWAKAMQKVKNTTNEELLAIDRLNKGVNSVDFRELLSTKRFSSLKESFSKAFAGASLDEVKNELNSYNKALLTSGKITEREFKKMAGAVEKFTEKELAELNRLKGGMTSLGEATSKMRLLFVQLTRIFIATMYIKQIRDWAEATEKLSVAVSNFKTNPQYNDLAEQMKDLKYYTGGAVNELQMLPAVNKAVAMGLDLSKGKLLELAEMTTKMSQAFGIDSVKAFKDFTEAAAKGSAIVMDNIGILLKQEEAYKRYFKTLKLSNITYTKWLNNLTQAQKRSIYISESMVELKKKTDSVTLVFNDFKTTANELSLAWKKLSMTLTDSGGMNLATMAVRQLIDVLNGARIAIEFLEEKLGKLFGNMNYSARNFSLLNQQVSLWNDGMLDATEVTKYLSANLGSLTKDLNQTRKVFDALTGSVKIKLSNAVKEDILLRKEWARNIDFSIGKLSLLKAMQDREFQVMQYGSLKLNTIARATKRYNTILNEMIGLTDKSFNVFRPSSYSSFENKLTALYGKKIKAIKELNLVFERYLAANEKLGKFDYVSRQAAKTKEVTDVMKAMVAGGAVMSGLNKWYSAFAGTSYLMMGIASSANTKIINSSAKATEAIAGLTERVKEYRSVLEKTLWDRDLGLAFNKIAADLSKSFNIGITISRKSLLEYSHLVKKMLKVGQVPMGFTEYFIDKFAATNKQVAKLKKNLDDLLEQWIKLKREAERMNMNAFDARQAKFVDSYRDKIKKVLDLYKQLKGYGSKVIFPNFDKSGVEDYYKTFKSMNNDLKKLNSGNLTNNDIFKKYRVSAKELQKILSDFGSGFIKEYEEKFIKPQEIYTERLLIAYNKTVGTFRKASYELKKLKDSVNGVTFDKAISGVKKFSSILSNTERSMYEWNKNTFNFSNFNLNGIKAIYRDMLKEARNYYKTIDELNYKQRMKELKLAEYSALKALEAQYSSIKGKDEELEKARTTIRMKYRILRDTETTRHHKQLREKLLGIDRQYYNAVKELYNNANIQMTEAMKYANKDLMTSGEFFYYSIKKVFDRATGKLKDFKTELKTIDFNINDLGWEGLKDFFDIGKLKDDISNAEKLIARFKETIPEEYRAKVYFDYHDDKFKVFKRDFAELGTTAQREIIEAIAKVNPEITKMMKAFKQPVDVLTKTFEDAFQKIAEAMGDLTYKMTIGLYEATNQMNADRRNELAVIEEEYAKGLISQQEYREKAQQIDLDYNKKKENYEKEAVKSTLMGLSKQFWAEGWSYIIKGGVHMADPTKTAQGAAELAGGTALLSLAGLLGLAGGSITTNNSAGSASKEAKNRGERDRYIIMDYNLFEDELSFSRTVNRALEV